MRNPVFFVFFLFFGSLAAADVAMTYPLESTVKNGGFFDAGFVAPGQTFDLVFSDNSGYDFEWDSFSLSTLPIGWQLVSTQRTDTSLVARVKVPASARSSLYTIVASFSSALQPGASESANVRVIVKKNLLDASIVRRSSDERFFVGGKAIYTLTLSNSSIAPETIRVSSNLPGNWFSGKSIVIKPGSVQGLELEVVPNASGKVPFTFQVVAGEDNLIIQTFSSELNVRPTLRGKFGSAMSGFPFFTISLLPFQLFDSFFSLVLP